MDFSLSGLQVVCGQSFRLGERVIIDLQYREERIDELTGLVCSMRPEADAPTQFRYGIRFCFEAGRHMRAAGVDHALRRIADDLRANHYYE